MSVSAAVAPGSGVNPPTPNEVTLAAAYSALSPSTPELNVPIASDHRVTAPAQSTAASVHSVKGTAARLPRAPMSPWRMPSVSMSAAMALRTAACPASRSGAAVANVSSAAAVTSAGATG